MASGYSPNPSVTYDKHGKIKRSGAAKDAFKREHHCLANGHTAGSCPGYVIDQVRPTGVRWRRRAQQHAVADRGGWQSEGQDRKVLSLGCICSWTGSLAASEPFR